jgi:glutamate synthase domain-containing protein 3
LLSLSPFENSNRLLSQFIGDTRIVGYSDDGVGKYMTGGRIIAHPVRGSMGKEFFSHLHEIVGTNCLYGAISGEAFLRGRAGDNFAARNAGAVAVVEGVGDFACLNMSGGFIIVLGEIGCCFGTGMSGGAAYVYDPFHYLPEKCDLERVKLERLSGQQELQEVGKRLHQHFQFTRSYLAENLLVRWPRAAECFVKVAPIS